MLDHLVPDELEGALLAAITDVFEGRRAAARQAFASALAAPPVDLSPQAVQLATAVLFLQVARADHELKTDEHLALMAALERALGLRGDAALMLVRVAEDKVGRTPLPELLNAIRANADMPQRREIVVNLWRLAYADAELQGHEEYFVRKVALAIGLSNADLVESKVTAREAFLEDDL
jgi:uncharacterized tellurite resistance protein B-like protein